MSVIKTLTAIYTGNQSTPTFNWTNDMSVPIVNSTANPAQLVLDEESFYVGNITCVVADNICNDSMTKTFSYCPDIAISDLQYCSLLVGAPAVPSPNFPYSAQYTKIKVMLTGLHPFFSDQVKVELYDASTLTWMTVSEYVNSLVCNCISGTTSTLNYLGSNNYELRLTIQNLEGTSPLNIPGFPTQPDAPHQLRITVTNNCTSLVRTQPFYIPRTANCTSPLPPF